MDTTNEESGQDELESEAGHEGENEMGGFSFFFFFCNHFNQEDAGENILFDKIDIDENTNLQSKKI